jgi:hypothetical protein
VTGVRAQHTASRRGHVADHDACHGRDSSGNRLHGHLILAERQKRRPRMARPVRCIRRALRSSNPFRQPVQEIPPGRLSVISGDGERIPLDRRRGSIADRDADVKPDPPRLTGHISANPERVQLFTRPTNHVGRPAAGASRHGSPELPVLPI